ncbi:MAG: alcohol dehydrogenase catalytic domain-containing protein [Acidobacteria bacterium]|nr:alcohol dehydrogenase catalytic domain-containing protein [Acidobacteriota bacterium]
MNTMRAVVFHGMNDIRVEDVAKPRPKAGEAVIRITATTICGTDVHIVRGEYPVRKGLILGHEPVGVIEELGEGLEAEYAVGQRVIVGAITPCGQCFYCLNGVHSQCHGALGGWRFGNTINGAWAEYLLVPDARANLALVPDELSDEQVLMLPDIASTGISGAESGNVRVGDSVAIFAQGPIGLCATVGARLRGAGLIVAVDPVKERREMALRFGASIAIDPGAGDVVDSIKRLTEGRGADVAIEALGRQETFEAALRSVRPGGTLSSLGVYSGKLVAPYDAVYAGLGDQRIVTTLCPGGKERMRRLLTMVQNDRVDLTPLLTHHFTLEQLPEAFDLFSRQADGVMKVVIHPAGVGKHENVRREPAAMQG